jgi:1,4-dihydroxy-2-naphthoyl-CoA synthase
MRGDGAGFETVGPKTTAFDSFDAADTYARKMLNQHTGQRFVVCRAVAAYEVEQVNSVKMLADDACKSEATAGDAKNILEMPSRKAM